MKFTADIEILENCTVKEIKAEIERYQRALSQKEAWDKLGEKEKDDRFFFRATLDR